MFCSTSPIHPNSEPKSLKSPLAHTFFQHFDAMWKADAFVHFQGNRAVWSMLLMFLLLPPSCCGACTGPSVAPWLPGCIVMVSILSALAMRRRRMSTFFEVGFLEDTDAALQSERGIIQYHTMLHKIYSSFALPSVFLKPFYSMAFSKTITTANQKHGRLRHLPWSTLRARHPSER